MEEMPTEWLPHLTGEIVSGVHGNFLDAYVIALEGWRRGLTLRWHAKDSEKFSELTTWFVDKPGQLFSLSSKAKTHYFFRTRGDKVTNEAVTIGKDKERTKQALIKAGVSTPKGKQFAEDDSDDAIREYVSSLGCPVVLKPTDGSFGRGVVTNINNKADLDYALSYVRSELDIKNIIIEQYIPGEEYRIYVVGNRVIGAINRIPANVIGDGINSIEMLIANKNEERSKNPRLISCPIKIDAETERFIGENGFTINSIPKRNEKVFLSKKSNISLGGDPVDVLDDLPEEIKMLAVNALKAVPGLEHGAVDIIINPNQPIKKAGYVLELNPTAQIGSILYPLKGKSRDVPSEIIDFYFPETKNTAQLNSLVYFDLQEVLAPISKKAASITEVAPIIKTALSGRKYIITGNVQDLAFHQKIKEKAIELSVMGKINKMGSDKIAVIVVGERKVVEEFKQFINKLKGFADIERIFEEDWYQPIKLGFEIQGESKNLLVELDNLEDKLIKAKKEQKKLEKQYHYMLRSNSWKLTEPFRKAGSSVKKIMKRN